ncbi:Glycosyltransferase involved in cell wall bisynthesis [Halogranum amylolyticum]|uniref:Glycosyltransferase involved in cell wall bisynthesis n=1 Tax=Halogranum amylolyticum TaxID=660520 RepID=A0A1H8N006_9EURY|nr:glycosyltransferase family 4 protein [Halogranum amylolyticum]SEO22884.1 Glycosyltransferase involved in cell wall bisynthesis [Halogranum amylolyticum]
MRATEILLIGPAGKQTGGIARYIHEQRRRLGDGARVYDVAVPDSETPLQFLRAALLALAQLVQFPFRRPPDVVHVHTSHWYSFFQSSAYILYAASVWRVPVVLHVHGSSFDTFVDTESRLLGAFQSFVFARCTTVVVLSDYWSDVVADRVDPAKLFVLPNAVDPTDYDPRYGASPPHVVFVSNHIERKGVAEFVAAVDDLLEAGARMQVTIAGSGPLSHLAEELAARRAAVTYEGYVSETRKRELLNEGSVFVLPTHAENLPIALLEAMAGGNALVSTTVGAIPSLVDDDNGVLVAPGDEVALRGALSSLLADPTRIESMARTSRARAEREYSWRTAVDSLEGLYAELAH